MPADVEITDDTSREDVGAIVKDLMDERRELEGGGEEGGAEAGEKAGAEAGDETSKQTDVGDDASADDDAAAGQDVAGGEDLARKDLETSQLEDWLTDEVRAELPRWVSDDDLEGFSSREELDRALGLTDRAALAAGRESGQAGGEGDQDERRQEHGQEGKFIKRRQESQREGTEGQGDPLRPPEIDLDLSDFDEELGKKVKAALTGLRDHYEERMQSLDDRFATMESAAQTSQVAATEAQFDAIVDSLGHADLFGQTGEETPKQLKARQDLFDDHWAYLSGLRSLGREGQMGKASVDRVLHMTFADHLSRQEKKNLTKRMQRQSNMRTSVGAERPGDQEFQGPLKDHPDVQHAYKDLRRSRGEE